MKYKILQKKFNNSPKVFWSLLEYLFNKVADLQASNFILKRLQHRCFSVNIAKLLRPSILKNICKSNGCICLLKYFVKTLSILAVRMLRFAYYRTIWLQVIYFITTIAFWFVKYLFRIDGDDLGGLAKDFTLCSIYRTNQTFWKIHEIA